MISDGFHDGDTTWGEVGDGFHNFTRYAEQVTLYGLCTAFILGRASGNWLATLSIYYICNAH